MKNVVIVGCGLFGSVCGRILAEKGFSVTILEKESYVGGLAYDYKYQNSNIMVHKFGPHILNLDHSEVYDFLSRFCILVPVDVKRKVYVNNRMIPLPLNLESIKMIIGEERFIQVYQNLVRFFPKDEVLLGELTSCENEEIRTLGRMIYDKVYLGYNIKMWGKRPEEVNSTILQRMPIRLNYNKRLTRCRHQVVPQEGYHDLLCNMLNHGNIEVKVKTDGTEVIKIAEGGTIYYKEKEFQDILIYTGPIDELFDFEYGKLQYRSIRFKNQLKKNNIDDSAAVITYPDNYKKTRTTDMRMLIDQPDKVTVWVSEYPGEYVRRSKKYGKPSYPVNDSCDVEIMEKYKKKADLVDGLYLGGRLAEYKYYSMEETVLSAINCAEEINKKYGNKAI
mgnify:CR=1 FL=1